LWVCVCMCGWVGGWVWVDALEYLGDPCTA